MARTIELGDDDAFLLIRADGTFEASIPNKVDEFNHMLPNAVAVAVLVAVAAKQDLLAECQQRVGLVSELDG